MYKSFLSKSLIFIGLSLSFSMASADDISNFQQNPTFSASKKLLSKYAYNGKNPSLMTEFYCGCEIKKIGNKLVPDLDSCGYEIRKNKVRAERIEWEHVVPAWEFGHQIQCWNDGKGKPGGGRKNCESTSDKFNKMESDMNNLWPSVGEVNADRSNFRYSDFGATPNQYGQCKFYTDFKARKVQPDVISKGQIARTYLYFQDTYDLKISDQQLKLFNAWNKMYPVTDIEKTRNQLILKLQGTNNKFID